MDFVENFNSKPAQERFFKLPVRLFMDTNIVQYLSDFAEFICDGYSDEGKLFTSNGREIGVDSFLYKELNCLRQIFLNIERSPFHFAVSYNVFKEVQQKNDPYLTRWFSDLWDYWQAVLGERGENAFVGFGRRKLARIQSDSSIKNGLSKSDFKILCDALELECDAILTCDKYRSRQGWIYSKYGIMVLYPSDFLEITNGFHSLWC